MNPSITVSVNGERRVLPAGHRLDELVAAHTASTAGVAVAVDGEVVPRAAWPSLILADGAGVEILTAVQGG
jgi:sulfur carrier protein